MEMLLFEVSPIHALMWNAASLGLERFQGRRQSSWTCVCVCVCAQFSSVGSISHTFVLFDSQDKSGVGGSGGRLSLLGKTEVHRGAGVPAQALNAYLYYLLVLLNLKKLA